MTTIERRMLARHFDRAFVAKEMAFVAKSLMGASYPSWAEGSNAYNEERRPYAKDWVGTAARHNGIKMTDWADVHHYGPTHVAVTFGGDIHKARNMLTEALGREVEAYRDGWLVTEDEARWMGFKPSDWKLIGGTHPTVADILRRL